MDEWKKQIENNPEILPHFRRATVELAQDQCFGTRNIVLRMIENLILGQEEIDAYRRSDGWILVSERLPENYLVVLLTLSGVKYPIVGYYSKTYEKFASMSGGEYPVSIVTHWMPLPEPPKGE